ncbi:unnamed protein product [Peronospora farinosa]|uniref:Uncharacterized protein n=1 Tax=Peronospora farinosa TaxID=134698 RepID=A0AAV0U8Q4_9STRA|nr:unnamed protein product [Peronospora farinosa]CAI5733154.1 unnamed protein product [Peronospora farinosa]
MSSRSSRPPAVVTNETVVSSPAPDSGHQPPSVAPTPRAGVRNPPPAAPSGRSDGPTTPSATLPGRGTGREAPTSTPHGRGAGRVASSAAPSGRGAGRVASSAAPSGRGAGQLPVSAAPPGRGIGRRAPDSVPRAQRVGRYVPSDSLFQALEEAAANNAPAAEFRAIALRDVQRSRVAVSEKFKLFIPCGAVAASLQLDEVMLSIHMEDQSALWKDSLPTLCDFIRIPSKGIRFTCTSRDVAVKLGGSSVRIFGAQHIIKKFSLYERLYTLNLTRIPSDLDDALIFDFFATRGLHVLVTATHQVGGMTSRDRTVWCTTEECPSALFLPDGSALREIYFDGFADPVFVQHKQRSLNTKPPSLIKRDLDRMATAEAQRAASRAAAVVASGPRVASTASTASSSPQSIGASPASVAVDPDDVRLDIVKPEASASLLDWTVVTRPIVCSQPESRPPATAITCGASLLKDERMVFGIPAPPTDFELAFAEDCQDVDVDVFLDGDATIAPVTPSCEVGQLIASHSLLTVSRTKMKRSRFKGLASGAQTDFLSVGDPEGRLASITAQPLIIAPVLHDLTPESTRVVVEHAVLRAYSGFPAVTHTTSRQLAPRIRVDFPDGSPAADEILAHVYPSTPQREMAQAYASVDLFFRTHASRIYNDPFKVGTIAGLKAPDCLPYSDFILWSDTVLHALCHSDFTEGLEGTLPFHVEASLALIRSTSDDDMASDSESSETSSDGMQAL